MTKIKTARTTEGEKFYYLGHTQAVVNDAGDSIEDLLAEQDEKIELLNDNTGVSDYPEFSTSETYETGTIVKYEGALYKFTADHAAGIWDSGEVKAWNTNAETQEKLSELGSLLSKNVSNWQAGYYNSEKVFTSLSTWKACEVQLTNATGIFINADCTGKSAYCFLLDGDGNVIEHWNNEMVNSHISLVNKNAKTLLVSSRAEYNTIVRVYKTIEEWITESESNFNSKISETINNNILIAFIDKVNLDTVNGQLRIPGYRIINNSKRYSSESTTALNIEVSDIMLMCLYDTKSDSIVVESAQRPVNANFIYLFSFNSAKKKVYGLNVTEFTIDGEIIYATPESVASLRTSLSQVDSWIASQYDLPNDISVVDGVLTSGYYGDSNDKIAWINGHSNLWWIGADLVRPNHNRINIGLVLSETKSKNYFRMLKYISATGELINKQLAYFSRVLSSWKDNKVFIDDKSDDSSSVMQEASIKMAVSGNVIHAYDDNNIVGHAITNNMSSDGRSTMFGGILFGSRFNKAVNINYKNRNSPYAHFSVDDVVSQMRDLTENSSVYNSVFDNTFFSFWKGLHDEFGVVVTFNLFYDDGDGWSLDNMTTKFRNEFIDNQSWMKFAFHGENPTIKYNDVSNNESALSCYNNMLTQVNRFASLACWDKMPRLTFFSGNKELLASLKNTGMFVGCLTADDERTSNCGLSELELDCINNASDYIDFERGLYYVRSSMRIESENAMKEVISEMDKNSRNVVYEYFNHGQQTDYIRNIAAGLSKRNVRFDYPQNNLPF